MRIIFVRHGHPDYKNDCLTELGHTQAEAAAKRLKNEKIDAFFSSSCGRAAQTAEHIAMGHDMEVELLDFMREISWRPKEGEEMYENGHPWRNVEKMVAEHKTLMSPSWGNEEPFCKSTGPINSERVSEEFDKWIAGLGYTREGDYYRVGKPKYETVLLASHGGSSSAVLGHIFNLPMPFVYYTICPKFTAITIVTLSDTEGELVSPRFEIMNDAEHIKGLGQENNVYKN